MNLILKIAMIIILLIMGLTLALSVTGCISFGKPKPPDSTIVIPETLFESPKDVLYKIVYKTNWLIALSIIGASLSMAAYINGSKTAVAIGIGSLTALGLSLATIRYAEWLAGASIIAAVLIFIATVVRKNLALKQIITGIQKVKIMLGQSKGKLDLETDTNANNINDILGGNQNKDTTALVLEIKDALKLAGKI